MKSKNLGLVFLSITLLTASTVLQLVAPLEVKAAFPGQNGRVAFISDRDGDFDIYSMKIDGTEVVQLTNDPASDIEPVWSPDGTKLLFRSQRNGADDVYIMNADGSNVQRLTNTAGQDIHASLSPDGSKIAFASQRDGNFEIYTMNPDGTNQTRITNNTSADAHPRFSPDGSKIVFRSTRDDPNNEIYTMNVDGSGVLRLTNTIHTDSYPNWSPDGTKITFHTNRDGVNEIYTMNPDGTNQTRLTTSAVGVINVAPDYSPDGNKITFQSTITSGGDYELVIMDTDGSNQVVLTSNSFTEQTPAIQPLAIAPTVNNDTINTPVNTPVAIDVLANDADNYSSLDPTTVAITQQPSYGTLAVNTTNGVITYSPDSNFNGIDNFAYQVCSSESSMLCSTGTVRVTVGTLAETTSESMTTLKISAALMSLGVLGSLGYYCLRYSRRS